MLDFMKANLVVTEIITACHVNKLTSEAIHNDRSSHGVVFFESGERVYDFSDGKSLYPKINQILYLPKGSTYRVDTNDENRSCYAINFQLIDDSVYEPFVFKPKNFQLFFDCFKNAERAWRQRNIAFEMSCKADLYTILCNMQKEFNNKYMSSSKRGIIEPALTYIHQNYMSEAINACNLSEMCGISYEYFRQLFQNYYGCSPIKYINNLRLSRAKGLLQSGMYSVSEVAYQSGFTSLSHFSRFFKAGTGVLPSEYT